MKSNNSSLTVRFILGIVGMVVFGVLLIVSMVAFLVVSIWTSALLPLPIIFGVLFVLSGFLMNSGAKRKRVIARLSRYMAELTGNSNVLGFDDMAALTGFTPMQVKSDMRMLKRWALSFDLYTDRDETAIIKGKSNYDEYLRTERQREELEREKTERQNRLADPETATIETFRLDGAAILDKLRAANLVLPGESISRNLDELEKTTKRIFDHIDSHPEKLPETRKLMNYHLPTTLKLIDKYCQYDTMDYQPQNVAEAKIDIEKALIAANEAFANFLDKLFHVDTLDVATDAEVLTKMFEQDGLTGNKFNI